MHREKREWTERGIYIYNLRREDTMKETKERDREESD
jgi:hypothetical protein